MTQQQGETPPDASEPARSDLEGGSDGAPAPEPTTTTSAWATLRTALSPRATKAQLLAAVLTALLGFALVVQMQQNRSTDLSGLSQQELVRILDEVTQRTDDLEKQAADLRNQRAELVTGTDTERAAQEAAAARAQVQGILAGRLPAQGPGVTITLREGGTRLSASQLVDVLESLRNAGAEAIQLGDLRLTASTYIIDTTGGVEVDGQPLEAPYRWVAIGDPDTLKPALEMPGGAMAAIRNDGATTDVRSQDSITIDVLRSVPAPRWATPVPSPATG